MSYSYNDFGPKEPGDTITVDFTYESREDIEVLVDGVLVEDTLWEWANDGLLLCKAGFPLGATGRVRRITDISDLSGRLVGTAVLDYPTINGNFDRLLFRLQEQDDGEADREARVVAVEQSLEHQQDNLDASVELGRRWAEEEVDVEVVPGGYSSKHHAVKAGGHASSASSSKDAAIAAKDQAEIARDASVVARGGSESARDLAQKWAEEEEDTEVVPGHYSALHWAKKALGVVVGGLASGINGAGVKTTPADNDELALVDSADSWSLKKLTWANIKATLKTYFDTLYAAAGNYLPLGGGTMGTGAVITFAPEVGDKLRLYGTDFGIGVEDATTNFWGGSTYRFRGDGSSSGTILAEIVAAATHPHHLTRKDYVDGRTTISSQAQAEAGADNTTMMTPLRTAQAIAARSPVGLYTGTNQYEAIFPLGHSVLANCPDIGHLPNRNGSPSSGGNIFIGGGTNDYVIASTSSGARLAGTWRSRGTSSGVTCMQRVA